MKTSEADVSKYEQRKQMDEVQHERWAHCHVNWTAVWLGALATFSAVLLFCLMGTALGAHLVGPENRLVDMRKLGLWTIIFSVCAAFFSSVIGGWIAGQIAGIRHSEPAMLHGAFVWLVMVPILVACSAVGASSLFGGWYGNLGHTFTTNSGTPYDRPDPVSGSASPEEIATYKTQQNEYMRHVKQWQEDTPKAVRNGALMAITALLLGLLGSVIGGWMAAGEPMNFTHYLTRKPRYHSI